MAVELHDTVYDVCVLGRQNVFGRGPLILVNSWIKHLSSYQSSFKRLRSNHRKNKLQNMKGIINSLLPQNDLQIFPKYICNLHDVHAFLISLM